MTSFLTEVRFLLSKQLFTELFISCCHTCYPVYFYLERYCVPSVWRGWSNDSFWDISYCSYANVHHCHNIPSLVEVV